MNTWMLVPAKPAVRGEVAKGDSLAPWLSLVFGGFVKNTIHMMSGRGACRPVPLTSIVSKVAASEQI